MSKVPALVVKGFMKTKLVIGGVSDDKGLGNIPEVYNKLGYRCGYSHGIVRIAVSDNLIFLVSNRNLTSLLGIEPPEKKEVPSEYSIKVHFNESNFIKMIRAVYNSASELLLKSDLIASGKVKGIPFSLVTTSDDGFYIVIGNSGNKIPIWYNNAWFDNNIFDNDQIVIDTGTKQSLSVAELKAIFSDIAEGNTTKYSIVMG